MSPRKFIGGVVLVIAAGASLGAGSWSDFEEAFPAYPCHDGWMACRVDGESITPDMRSDGMGMPTPAHHRVGWHDLEATVSFSPFAGLSRYTGEVPGGAEPPPAPEPVAPAVAEVDHEAEAARRAAAEASAANDAAARQAEEAKAAREAAAERAAAQQAAAEEAAQRASQADAAERSRLEAEAAAAKQAAQEAERQRQAALEEERRRAEEARKAEEERKRLDAERLAAEEAARVAAEQAAADAAAAAAAAAPEPGGETGDGVAAASAAVRPPEVVKDCSDIVKLEPAAMLGRLSEGQVGCLEGELAGSDKMTTKGKISRVLMVNAFAKGDKKEWERLVKRHLDEIDQSDPDLCYKYALHLSKKGPGSAHGVIRWADVALENRTVWTGDTYTSRVNSLYKLRVVAAQKLWQRAESKHAAEVSDETQADVDKYRNTTKVLAREWYEYAKQAGKDTTKALQVCMSAAGTADYCEAQ